MQTRLYTSQDYATICGWWEQHGGKCVPEHVLPKCGVIVENADKEIVAAGWLYMDNSVGIAWLAWLVSNPKQNAFKVAKGIRILLLAIEELCKEFNYGILFTMTDRESLGRFFEQNDFTSNHSNATQYFRRIL